MSLPDSFYIALCMTILLVGAVYWVWTQIQYVQRKVNVLENIVYELKTLYSKQSELDGPVAPAKYPPAPTSVIGEEDEDLLRETLQSEEEQERGGSSSPTMKLEEVADVADVVAAVDNGGIAPFEAVDDIPMAAETASVPELPAFEPNMFGGGGDSGSGSGSGGSDLQPGGVGSGVVEYNSASALEAMSVKELRRLAQEKGVSGVSDMKKKELVIAIRSTPMESFLE